jgi:hypothetical protein
MQPADGSLALAATLSVAAELGLTVDDAIVTQNSRELEGMNAGMRVLDVAAPHFTDRVDEAETTVRDRPRPSETSGWS